MLNWKRKKQPLPEKKSLKLDPQEIPDEELPEEVEIEEKIKPPIPIEPPVPKEIPSVPEPIKEKIPKEASQEDTSLNDFVNELNEILARHENRTMILEQRSAGLEEQNRLMNERIRNLESALYRIKENL